MKRDLRFKVFYPHPPQKVWKALTDSQLIAKWLMENDFKPIVGHKFQFKTEPRPGFDGIVRCEVLEVEEPLRLSYSWKGGGMDTIVTFTLEAVGEGTRLTLEHTGFTGLKGMMVSFILSGGWKKKILRKKLLEIVKRIEDN